MKWLGGTPRAIIQMHPSFFFQAFLVESRRTKSRQQSDASLKRSDGLRVPNDDAHLC